MPTLKGYPKGKKQSSTIVVNPMPVKKTNSPRKGIRKGKK